MRLDCGDGDDSGPNLTPLIDMVFLLLVFFLAATTFADEEAEMDLTLPEARSGEPGSRGQTLVIDVSKDGALRVDGRAVSLAGLQQKLRAAATRNAKQEVLIRSDTRARYGVVASAVDACRVAELRRLAFAVLPSGSGSGEGGGR